MSFNEIPTRLDNIEKWFQISHLAQHRKKRSELLSTNRFHFKLIASSQVHLGRLSRDASIYSKSLIDDRRKELNKKYSFGFSRRSSNINKRTLQRSHEPHNSATAHAIYRQAPSRAKVENCSLRVIESVAFGVEWKTTSATDNCSMNGKLFCFPSLGNLKFHFNFNSLL